MIEYIQLHNLFVLSKNISDYVNSFNDIIIDCTEDNKILNASLLCKNIPKIIKISPTDIMLDSYKNARFCTNFDENKIGPDEQVRLLIFDNLNFLNDNYMKNFIDILQFPLISKTEIDKIKISRFTKYYKTKQLESSYFLYLAKS